MVEVSKPDYLSLVNQGGSGFNISELVTSIVAAEIEPKKILENQKQQKATNAISGIGFLNSQATLTKADFTSVSSDKYFSLASSNTAVVDFEATDETKLSPSQSTIENVTLAKKMVFELPGFTSLTDVIASRTLTVNFGSWSKSGSTGSDTNSFSSGKTYLITSAVPADEKSNIFNNSDLADADAVVVGAAFTATGNGSTTSAHYKEVEKFAFSASSAAAQTVAISGTISNIVSQLDAVSGISAKLVKTTSDGSSYSIVLSSESTGASNGFKITADNGSERWETSAIPATNDDSNTFNQLSTDATLSVDGVSVTRTTNTVTDVIPGMTINLKSDSSSAVQLSVARSKSDIKASLESVINSMNGFRDELDRLTYIDVDGENNGPLSNDTAVKMMQSNFKKLMIEPLSGYGADNIYLSQLGIKTNASGSLYLDTSTFDRTYAANPEYFNAIKDENISTSSANATATMSQFGSMSPGKYEISYDGSNWKIGTKTLERADYNSGSRFTSSDYPGLVIDTTETNPATFNLFVGKSISEKVKDFMDAILSSSSSVSKSETAYKATNTDIALRLSDLEEREKLLTTSYTERFGAMETAMTQFNSTKTLLENFVEAWKKQK